MGYKSTKQLTREQAETLFVDLRMEIDDPRNGYRALAVRLDDKTLEDVLEKLNDSARGGEGFRNYLIVR